MAYFLTTLIVHAIIGFLCAHLAKEKGKDSTTWGLLGFLFGIFALLFIAITKPVSDSVTQAPPKEVQPLWSPENETKKCPTCAEDIKLEALKCRFCGEMFDEVGVQEEIERRREEANRSDTPFWSIENETRKCPACAEHIKLEALKCRFCGEVFDQSQVQKEIEDWRRKRQKGLTESELPDDEESTPGLLTYLQEMHESGNALKVCSHCEHLSSEVCRKLRFNVRDYPKRFTRICNGEHFKSRSTQ